MNIKALKDAVASTGWLTLLAALHFAVVLLAGCNNNRYLAGQPAVGWQGNAALPLAQPPNAGPYQQVPAQMAELQRRVQQLDDNNRQLTTQLAQSQQQMQVFRERGDLMQRQLQDTAAQLQQSRIAQQSLQGQAAGMQASMSLRGGATLKANNSLLASAATLQIPGASVQPDGDLIRIRIPADQLFAPGTGQLNPAGSQILDAVGASLTRQFPRQRVAIEGHTDTGQLYGGAFTTPSQLAGTQAQAVMDTLVRRNGVPTQQLFVIAHGPNHPLSDNQSAVGRAENRRIEVVIYPEVF